MSGGIIQTAVTNPALRLELDYRVSSTAHSLYPEDRRAAESGIEHTRSSITSEFACLLNVLRGIDGETL